MASTAIEPGAVVGGRFRIERLLGEGGMGAVFAAQNTVTGKRVALKWMHPEIARNPDASTRFIREAQVCARVQHPNVVDVYDVLSEDTALFLVMELLEGEQLGDLMQRETTSLPELISLLLEAMRGVAAAHKQGVVHRDIKPDNIFLARRGDSARPVPKVLDFGISKLTGINDVSITQTGAAIGTPLYMSVEQLSGLRDIDARTDIYAFGVILYQAVTGQPPFQADTFPVLIAKIMTEHAVPPKTLRPEIPLALSRLIEWAMAKDRSARLSSMDEFIRELEPFGTELGFRGQMTIGGSDIPSVRTPASASSRAPAAHVVRTVPLKPALVGEAVGAPRTPVPSVRPREALLDTPGTLAPVITTPDEPAAEIPGQRRVGARAVAAVLVVVALLVGWWLLPHGQPADQHSAHIVVPATHQAMLAPITTPTVAPHVETTTVGAANTLPDPGAVVPPTTIPTTDGAAKAEQAIGSKLAAQAAAGTVHAAHPPHGGTTTRKGAQLTAAAQTPVVTPAAAANTHVSTDSSSNTRERKASSGRFRAGVPDRAQFMSQ